MSRASYDLGLCFVFKLTVHVFDDIFIALLQHEQSEKCKAHFNSTISLSFKTKTTAFGATPKNFKLNEAKTQLAKVICL